jgi:YidC/Oxa1 family membrane protein insertase
VNKNTLLAFGLILATIYFFQSPFYYKKILKQPLPQQSQQLKKDTVPQQEPSKQEESFVANQTQTAVVDTQYSDTTAMSVVTADTIVVETPEIIVGIDEVGGNIVSVRTKKYHNASLKNKDSAKQIIELVPQGMEGGANLSINGENYDGLLFEFSGQNTKIMVGERDSTAVSFVHTLKDGQTIEKRFVFHGTSYKIDYQIISPFIAGKSLTVGWTAGINESEDNNQAAAAGMSDVRKAHLYDSREIEHIERKKPGVEDRTGMYKWAAVTSKYFLIALVDDEAEDADVSITTKEIPKQDNQKQQFFNYGYKVTMNAAESAKHFWIYAGPTDISDLQKFDVNLQKVLYGGWRWFFRADIWFPWICEAVLKVLLFLYSIVKDYGIAILLITLIMKLVTYPLTQSSNKAMSKMKDVQPKLNAIRQKYKNDPQKMNQALMELYKKEGVNPMNPGCLPMFIQMPILFSLFIVLRKAIELRGASSVLFPWIDDLSQAEVLFRLPFTLPFYGDNFAIIPIVSAALTFIQQKQTMKDPNQQAMIYIMPIFMLALFNAFPSGLVIYFTFSTALAILQQTLTNKQQSAKPQISVQSTGKKK